MSTLCWSNVSDPSFNNSGSMKKCKFLIFYKKEKQFGHKVLSIFIKIKLIKIT